jgi:regulatory protein
MSAPHGNRGRRPRYRGPDGPTPGGVADVTPDADPVSVARNIVLRQLTVAPRSRAQLAQKLADRGTPTEVADQVLDRMEQVGLVDDVAFAQTWVRSRSQARGLSRRALGYELRDKGIDDETARAALDQVDDDAELATARDLVARRLPAMRGLARDKQVSRLVGMLGRKGYASGVAFRVVRDALAASDRDDVATPEPLDD